VLAELVEHRNVSPLVLPLLKQADRFGGGRQRLRVEVRRRDVMESALLHRRSQPFLLALRFVLLHVHQHAEGGLVFKINNFDLRVVAAEGGVRQHDVLRLLLPPLLFLFLFFSA